jgi:hypothetical protein
MRDAAAEMDVLFPEDQADDQGKKRKNKEFGCQLGCQHDKARRSLGGLWLCSGAGDGTRTRTDV